MTSRRAKYKRRKRNEAAGLAFLPSSDSDSDQESVPRSQAHLQPRDVRGLPPEKINPISKNTSRGEAVDKVAVKRHHDRISTIVGKRVDAEIRNDGLNAEVVHEFEDRKFVIRIPGLALREASLEYKEEEEEQMLAIDGKEHRSLLPKLDFWYIEIPACMANMGVGDKLARAALDYAAEKEQMVRLTHPFLRKWLEEHGTAAHRAIVTPCGGSRAAGGLLAAGTVNIPRKSKWQYKAAAHYGMG